MAWRSLIIGLLLGVAVGWLLGGARGEGASDPGVSGPAVSRIPDTGPSLQGSPRSQAAKADQPPLDVVRVAAKGSALDVRRAAGHDDLVIPDAAVAAAAARLDVARADRDWRLFEALLDFLGLADTEAADRRLVEVLGDETLAFPTPMGNDFHRYLAGSTVEGIADAARKRLLKNLADGSSSWVATHGWVDLVADHGTRNDVAWLLLEAKGPRIRDDGAVAVAKSPSEVATAWMEEALALPLDERGLRAGHGSYDDALQSFVRAHGEDAFPMVSKIVEQELAGTTVITNMKLGDLLALYGRTVPEERAAEAARTYSGLAGERDRIAAVAGVLAMRKRGLDVSGLEPILRTPLDALRSVQAARPVVLDGVEQLDGPTVSLAYDAMYALKRRPALWSEEAARELEATATSIGGLHSVGGDMREAAKKIRAGLESPWRAD